MNNRGSRQELLHLINVSSFVIDDTKLFLDTHPDNREALAHFHEYSRIRNQALAEYAHRYGPTDNRHCQRFLQRLLEMD